jgi:hypothetical protein
MFESWENNINLSLKLLTLKLISLLAIVTAHRIQTLNFIDVNNIKYDSGVLVIKIPSTTKTSKPGVFQPVFRFVPYTNKKLCVVEVVNTYLQSTSV